MLCKVIHTTAQSMFRPKPGLISCAGVAYHVEWIENSQRSGASWSVLLSLATHSLCCNCLSFDYCILCMYRWLLSCETVVQTGDDRVLHLHLQHLERERRWWLGLVPWSLGQFCRTLKQDLWEETGQTGLSWPLPSRMLGSKEQWQQRWAHKLWLYYGYTHHCVRVMWCRKGGREGRKAR